MNQTFKAKVSNWNFKQTSFNKQRKIDQTETDTFEKEKT